MKRFLCLAPGLTLTLIAAWGLPHAGLGQAPPAARARPDDLLKSAPFDRITLIDNAVFDVEPLSPRPLPPVDPKKKSRSLAEKDEDARKAEDARPRKNDPFSKKDPEENEQPVIIHLLEGEPRDFKVKRASIKDVEYFEDMLLAEGDRLVKAGEYARAFERFLLVKARDPNWKGLEERVDRLLFEEGSAALTEDNARGLRLLTDLHARRPDYPGLADRLASSYTRRIDRAFEAGDYLVGRRLVRELDQLAPGHPEARSARGRFESKAKALMDQAARATPSDRVDRLAEAARVWPALDGLERAYREAFRIEPTLMVAVDDLAEPVGPFPASPASKRVARLLYLPVLASDDEQATRGESPGQLLAGLESADLGKGLKINLRSGFAWSDGSRPVSAIDVARSLADRALPASPGYNARWADLLDRIEAVDENRLEVKLTRPSMKPETWLLDPVGPAHAASDGWIASLGQGRRPVGDGPYRWESSVDAVTLLHSVATEGEAGSPRIKRIREVRHPNPASSVEALLRGDVALLEHVPPDRLAEVLKVPDQVKVGRFSTPSVHRLALDGRNPALRNRKLRRALSMAIDRRSLLEEVLLRHPPDDVNLAADGPFVKGSFVDAQGVEPLEYNPLLAKGLVAAARKELGGNPIKLVLEYPSIAEARAVCPRIAESFTLVGVEVQLVERGESELESGLHAGRRFDLAYRASRPGQPLHDAGPLLLPGYDAPASAGALGSAASARILQLLIQLDRAPETTSARNLAMQIDRESRDELPVLPLWQLEDHYAWRTLLRGPGESADHLYQGIATWEIEPWFDKDPS
jgi:peptide/nickel transport system substrate-binding protein